MPPSAASPSLAWAVAEGRLFVLGCRHVRACLVGSSSRTCLVGCTGRQDGFTIHSACVCEKMTKDGKDELKLSRTEAGGCRCA